MWFEPWRSFLSCAVSGHSTAVDVSLKTAGCQFSHSAHEPCVALYHLPRVQRHQRWEN